MTDADKLAIAEEKLKLAERMMATCPDFILGELFVDNRGVGKGFVAYKRSNGACIRSASQQLSTHRSAIECCRLAYERLAAEREAALPECAKRWRKALEEIGNLDCGKVEFPAYKCKTIAREALKE